MHSLTCSLHLASSYPNAASRIPTGLQVLEDGGWGFKLLRDTIASYHQLPPAQLPTTDDGRLQIWVLQQSRVAGQNLGHYYRRWGWPVSDATLGALAGLPPYTATKFPA